jgi:hypothetical protein
MVLLFIAVASKPPCVWTDKNCARTKITEKTRYAVYWDPVLPVIAEGRRQACTDRFRDPQNDKAFLNATAMGRAFGKSSLSIGCHSFPKRTVYAPQKKIKVMTIHLVAERSSSAFESKPQRLSCLFTDTECTCGEHLEQSGCVDFVFDDPEREPKFKPRDCAPSMICDCEGTSVCSKTTVTGSVWKARWAVEEAHIPTFRYLASPRQRSRMRI